MWRQRILTDTRNAISLPASASGRTRSGSQDGPQAEMFGLDHLPVSPSVPQESARVQPTSGTCGPNTSALSASASLQQSLASKLQQRLATGGSTLFSLTWNQKDTPARRPYCQLVASARHIEGTGSLRWDTPAARTYKDLSRSNNPAPAHQKRNSQTVVTQAYLRGYTTNQIPALLCGLMGFPCRWSLALVSAMRLCQGLPRK